jgi:transposase
MKFDFSNTRIFVRPGSTDLRKGVSGLSFIIRDGMNQKPMNNSVYIFCNKNRTLLKVLWWDKTGFWLAQKKLEEEKWPWPDSEDAAREITTEQTQLLLTGIDFWCAHKELYYSDID